MRHIASAIAVLGWLALAIYAMREERTVLIWVGIAYASVLTVSGVLDPMFRKHGKFNSED